MPKAEVFYASSRDETLAVARALTEHLQAGDLLILTGELGVGKTVFAKGVGTGLGVTQKIVSPTFTLVREYKTRNPNVNFLHIDAYRMDSDVQDLVPELETLGIETELERAVTLIEWGSKVSKLLGAENTIYIDIALDFRASSVENVQDAENIPRIITVTGAKRGK
jgi:tRNA threonylcarbamoyladenosine biosynthesis protein TsaE